MSHSSPDHSLHCRQYSRGLKGPILHRPVRPGTHQATCDPLAAVLRALLPCLLTHPQDRAGGVSSVPPVRHPGALQEGHICCGK